MVFVILCRQTNQRERVREARRKAKKSNCNLFQAKYDLTLEDPNDSTDQSAQKFSINLKVGVAKDTGGGHLPTLSVQTDGNFLDQQKKPSQFHINFPSWVFLCMNVDFTAKTLKWAIDGKLVNTSSIQITDGTQKWPATGAMVQINEVFGRLSNLKFYGKETPFEDIKCTQTGTLLAWDISTWTFKEENKAVLMEETICYEPGRPMHISLTGGSSATFSHDDAKRLCKNAGDGSLPTITSKANLTKALSALKLESPGGFEFENPHFYWMDLQITDLSDENTALLGPNYNPLGCNACQKDCKEIPCDLVAGVMCEFRYNIPTFTLKGLCSLSNFDTQFYPFYYHILYWIGESGDVIYQISENSRKWKIRNIIKHNKAESVYGLSHVIGDTDWIIERDEKCPRVEGPVKLSLSFCTETQFNCGDGSCIDIMFRCDARSDCIDGSDEFGCTLIDFSNTKNYNTEIISSKNTNDRSSKLDLYIDFNLKKFLDIDENNGFFRINFFIKLTWNDVRLQFFNLKANSDANTLTNEEYSKIWQPKILFINSELWRKEINEGPITNVNMNSSYHPFISGSQYIKTALIFTGLENNVSQSIDVR